MSEANLTPTIERIRRFAALTGGKDLVMVFLLYPGYSTSEEVSNDGMVAYARLQAEMMNHTEIPSIPILPLPKLDGLANILKSHQIAWSTPQATNKKPSRATPFDLLRQCSNHPPMSEAAAFLLTDLFSNLREIADACTNASPDFASSSPIAGMNDKTGTIQAMDEAYEMDGTFPANNTQATDDGSAHGKLEFFRDLQGDAQYRDLVEFWTVEYPV
ncbi:hypothetical protein M409DRAFT_56855 [Zasmidium cellare ATCC 36951]|uniref:Uncharacterized protein n=1 Tax=Zasmidium cellare ATCC 36951 TaxID=1080233 RepID=A0A6A6CER6_ZASCE|nr:uncharacterized protein M409DRAFT_56855 [Zasmidium cellare ATCC 36951]KAF2164149.1 hypothetical protein M409DRAFT_56855 [Zasmidium cellare ATCC 36951]